MSEWISVQERLPDVGERVLVFAVGIYDCFIGDTAIAITSMTDSNLLFPSLKGKKRWISPWSYFLVDYEITHWMLLPEEPSDDPKGE